MPLFLFFFGLSTMYFLFSKRKIDFFTLGYFSCAIYFLPGLFGWSGIQTLGVQNVIHVTTYISLSIVMSGLLFSAVAWDKTVNIKDIHQKHEYRAEFTIIMILSMLVGGLFISLESSEIFSPEKPDYGRIYSFFVPTIVLGMIYSSVSGKFFGVFIFAPLIALDLFAGNRESVVFSVLGGLMAFGQGTAKTRMAFSHSRTLVLAITVAYFLMIYKGLYQAVLAGRFDLVGERLLSEEYYLASAMRLESFVTLDLLNSVLVQNIQYNDNWLLALVVIVLPMADIFEFKMPRAISHFIADHSYGWLNFGVAGNIWADMHAAGGWLLFIFSALLYAVTPIFLNIALARSRSMFVSLAICIIGVILMFFSHRAGLFYTVTLVSRFSFFFLFVFVLIFVCSGGRLKKCI